MKVYSFFFFFSFFDPFSGINPKRLLIHVTLLHCRKRVQKKHKGQNMLYSYGIDPNETNKIGASYCT